MKNVQSLDSTDDVIAALDDGSPDVVRAAISRLVELDAQLAVAALRARLLDADLSLVPDIATALGAAGDLEGWSVAVAGLSDERYVRRLAAALALGIFGNRDAVQQLLAALGDPVAGVRAAALAALTRLGPGAEVIRQASALLSDHDPQVRVAAVRLALAADGETLASFGQLIEDENPLVRLEFARGVRRLADADAARLLADPDDGVRRQAALSAGRRQISFLAALLTGDRRADVRRAAARTLGMVGGERAVGALIGGLADADDLVRAAALQALERALTRSGAIAALSAQLASADPTMRRYALYALARLRAGEAGPADRPNLTTQPTPTAQPNQAVQPDRADGLERVIAPLADDPDVAVRFAVIETAETLIPRSEALLRYMTADPDPQIRASAEVVLAHRLR